MNLDNITLLAQLIDGIEDHFREVENAYAKKNKEKFDKSKKAILEFQKKISYLLGTCHHGSHKDWSPFAQARGIYKRYIKLTEQNDDNFNYDPEKGREIASLLSIKEKEIRERLTVYRAMQQLAAEPKIQSIPNGGIIDNYSAADGCYLCKVFSGLLDWRTHRRP